MKSSLSIPLFFASLVVPQVTAFCYRPDGSQITNPAFQPCNQVAGSVSMCCGTNHTGAIDPDVCLPNGLCQNTGDRLLWRLGCTDPTWESPFCLSLCAKKANGDRSDKNVAVMECSDGTFCCGGNKTCCDNKLGVSIAATIGASATTSTQTQSATSTGTSAPVTSTSSTSGLSNSAKVAIGVGVTGGVLAIVAAVLAFILIRRRRSQRLEPVLKSDVEPPLYEAGEVEESQAKPHSVEPRPVEVSAEAPQAKPHSVEPHTVEVSAEAPPSKPVELSA